MTPHFPVHKQIAKWLFQPTCICQLLSPMCQREQNKDDLSNASFGSECLFLFGKRGSFPVGWILFFFSFFKKRRNLRNKLNWRKYLSKWDKKKKLCAKEHCSSRSLFYKLSLVFKLVTAQWQAGRSQRFVKNKEEGDSPPPPSFIQPSCVCHFSFTSYIPRMLALLFPCVLLQTRWLHRMEQFGWWCLKEENRLCAGASQRPPSRMSSHHISYLQSLWNGVTLTSKSNMLKKRAIKCLFF